MAVAARMSVRGAHQGAFAGEPDGHQVFWIPVIAFTMGLTQGRDPQAAVTRRAFGPVTVTKAWDAASPQALQACVTSEVLSSVIIEFGKSLVPTFGQLAQRVTLTDSSFTRLERTFAAADSASFGHEEWDLTFRRVTVEDLVSGTSFAADWTSAI